MNTIVDSLDVHYQDEGKGSVILCLHGWSDNLGSFAALTKELAGQYRIVSLDLPGFGRSQRPAIVWGDSEYAEFVSSFVTKLKLDVVGLIGHSFGGRICISGVSSGSLKPRKLILIATSGIKKSQSLRNQSFKLLAKIGKLITKIPPLTRFQASLRQRLYRAAGSSDYVAAGDMKAVFVKAINQDLQGEAAKIKIPVLLVWGSDDQETPLADGQKFAGAIVGSKLAIINQTGHFVHQEQASEVGARIKDFLK